MQAFRRSTWVRLSPMLAGIGTQPLSPRSAHFSSRHVPDWHRSHCLWDWFTSATRRETDPETCQQSEEEAMLTLKVVVVGSCACGKTTLIRTFLRDDVRGSVPAPTVQEVYVGHMQHDGKKVRLVIWDTGDSDLLCDPHRASCYAEADVVLVCFSVRDIFSGSEVPTRWATEVRHFNPNVPVLLVATQMDLREDPVTVQELAQIKCRPSSVAEGLQLAQKIQAAHYVECSALDLASVRKVFESVLHTCLRTTQSRQKKSRWKCCC
ncbi:ras-like GTP-binding protein rhoA isoform X3 [Dermacentor albipictus]|uniref:ras-like GTP-binding protein rhoA isoform X3 n=1 Tax=Dermacentor albipictus TaxID=60249 RepID=UPI0031FD29B2